MVTFNCKNLFSVHTQQLIYISCFSIDIMAAILLIHGALKMNRFLLIYWLVVAVLRILLQSLIIFEIFYYHILESMPYHVFYTTLEILDYGWLTTQKFHHAADFLNFLSLYLFLVVLIASFCLVVNLYKQLKHRDENNFTRLENEV